MILYLYSTRNIGPECWCLLRPPQHATLETDRGGGLRRDLGIGGGAETALVSDPFERTTPGSQQGARTGAQKTACKSGAYVLVPRPKIMGGFQKPSFMGSLLCSCGLLCPHRSPEGERLLKKNPVCSLVPLAPCLPSLALCLCCFPSVFARICILVCVYIYIHMSIYVFICFTVLTSSHPSTLKTSLG